MKKIEAAVRHALRDSFLAKVRPPVVEELFRSGQVAEVSAGRVMIDEADPHRCGVMVSGLALVYLTRASGAQVTVRRVTTGAAIGIAAMVGRRSPVSVRAITDCVFFRLDAQRLIDLGRTEPTLGWAIAEEVSRRLEDTYLELASVGGSVRQRLSRYLLDHSLEGKPLMVRSSQEQLAAAIGASRETVGLELRRLRDEGLVELGHGHVTLVDALQLNSIAYEPGQRRALPAAARN